MSRMEMTPIKLPPALKRQARRRAEAGKVSLSEYVRQLITQDVQKFDREVDDPFAGAAPYEGSLPRDGSVNLDKYLRPRKGRP